MLEVLQRVKERLPLANSDDQLSDRYIVALDIGTENVKALIGKIDGQSVEIVGVGKAHQGLSDMQSGAIADIGAVAANCNNALAQAEEQAGVSPRAVVVGIAGELVKGATTSIKVVRKDGKLPLDIDEVEEIIGVVQSKAQDRSADAIKHELGGKEVDVQLVNSALVRMEIDGYYVTNPIGFQGKQVKVELYTAFAPLIHIGAIERVVQQLDMDLLAVAAEPFAVARSVLGNDTDNSMSAILMDIGGGTTDIAVIDEGGVQGTKMFGIGGRAFTQSIARELDMNFTEAESLKISYSKDALPDSKAKKVGHVLEQTTDVWRSGVELALEEFHQLEHLPHSMLLCGGGASLPMIIEELEQKSWYKDLPFTRKPAVRYISPNNVDGVIDTTGKVKDHTFITAMGLLRVGLDTLDNGVEDSGSEPSSVRQKINRMLRT